MGNCFGYSCFHVHHNLCISKDAVIPIFDITIDHETIREQYTILLKEPNGKACHLLRKEDHDWSSHDDINVILRNEFSDTYDYWLVYNDESPKTVVSNGAHAKGILAWNKTSIKWLIHSVPKFPKTFDGTSQFPDIDNAELTYGQSFVSLTMPLHHLDAILNQLFIMHPNVYCSKVPNQYLLHVNQTDDFEIYKINEHMHHVSKSPKYEKEFYSEMLLPVFGGPIYTETWIRGHQCVDTKDCKMIASIHWKDGKLYSYTKDHSKFCISEKEWVMIGDLNRMTSQIHRGGGGLVIQDPRLYEMFKKIAYTNEHV